MVDGGIEEMNQDLPATPPKPAYKQAACAYHADLWLEDRSNGSRVYINRIRDMYWLYKTRETILVVRKAMHSVRHRFIALHSCMYIVRSKMDIKHSEILT